MGELKKPKDKNNRSFFWRQAFVTAGVSLNTVGHGCIIGFAAILIPSLRLPESHIHATPSQESWIASILGFALITGNIIITPLMGTLGRKKSHLLTIIPGMVGWFLLLFVQDINQVIAARFIQGMALGMIGPLGSIIIGEMSDPVNRGAFLTCVSLSLTIGVLFCHTLGTYFSWMQSSLICSFITFISLIIIIYTPESPPWLISQGRIDEATEIYIWLRGDDEAQMEELDKMIMAQKMARKSSIADRNVSIGVKIRHHWKYFKLTITKPEFYKPITIMVFLYTMFQFSGLNVISSYATDIISQLVGPEANAKFLMVALDVQRLICNLFAVYLMKTLKRRTLLFGSGGLCVLSYIAQGLYVYARQNNKLPFPENQWVPIALIGIYMFSLTAGLSAIPFTVCGEVFPLEYRGLGSGISILGLSLNLFVSLKCFPVLTAAVGLSCTYFIYGGIVTLCLTVVWFMLPETKDKTLQDIEDSFRGLSPADAKSAQPLNEDGFEKEMMRRCSSIIIY